MLPFQADESCKRPVGFPFARKLMPSSDGAQERSSGPAVLNTSSFGYDTLVMPVFL